MMMHRGKHLILLATGLALLSAFLPSEAPLAHAGAQVDGEDSDILRGTISEIRDKRRALLVVIRSMSVDTRGPLRAVFEEVFEGSRPAPRHKLTHDLIAKRLERYTRDYGSLSTVESMDEADFVIVFKVVSLTRSFSPEEPFIRGEMFVILNRTPERPQPVLVWRSKGDQTSPDDAVGDFIKSLKAVRGER